MSRTTIKAAIKAFLVDIVGLKNVYEGTPKRFDRFPVAVIALPTEDESLVSMPARGGKRQIKYRARITLVDDDNSRNAIEGELAFDELIDSVKAKIREHPQLDGSVLIAGVEYIRTTVADPRLAGKDGGNVWRGATIEFDITDFVVG